MDNLNMFGAELALPDPRTSNGSGVGGDGGVATGGHTLSNLRMNSRGLSNSAFRAMGLSRSFSNASNDFGLFLGNSADLQLNVNMVPRDLSLSRTVSNTGMADLPSMLPPRSSSISKDGPMLPSRLNSLSKVMYNDASLPALPPSQRSQQQQQQQLQHNQLLLLQQQQQQRQQQEQQEQLQQGLMAAAKADDENEEFADDESVVSDRDRGKRQQWTRKTRQQEATLQPGRITVNLEADNALAGLAAVAGVTHNYYGAASSSNNNNNYNQRNSRSRSSSRKQSNNQQQQQQEKQQKQQRSKSQGKSLSSNNKAPKRRRSKPSRYGDMVGWGRAAAAAAADSKDIEELRKGTPASTPGGSTPSSSYSEMSNGAAARGPTLKRRKSSKTKAVTGATSSDESRNSDVSDNSPGLNLVESCCDVDLDAIVRARAKARVQEKVEWERKNAPKRQSRSVTAHLNPKERLKLRKERKLAQSRARRGLLNDVFMDLRAVVPPPGTVDAGGVALQHDLDTTTGQGDVLQAAVVHLQSLQGRLRSLQQDLCQKKQALIASGVPLPGRHSNPANSSSNDNAVSAPVPMEFTAMGGLPLSLKKHVSKRIWQALVQAPPLELALIMTAAQVQAQQMQQAALQQKPEQQQQKQLQQETQELQLAQLPAQQPMLAGTSTPSDGGNENSPMDDA